MINTQEAVYLSRGVLESDNFIKLPPNFSFEMRRNYNTIINVDRYLCPVVWLIKETRRHVKGYKATLGHAPLHHFVDSTTLWVAVKGLSENTDWVSIFCAAASVKPGFRP